MADLLDILGTPGGPKTLPVDAIWALDAVNHGDSRLLNDESLGNTCGSLPIEFGSGRPDK